MGYYLLPCPFVSNDYTVTIITVCTLVYNNNIMYNNVVYNVSSKSSGLPGMDGPRGLAWTMDHDLGLS